MATSKLLGQRAVKGQEPYRLDVELQSVQFYPNVLEDELLKPGRFKPYLSATIDKEKVRFEWLQLTSGRCMQENMSSTGSALAVGRS